MLLQLGSPKSPSIKDVRSYLKEFLADPRVVDLNPFFWKIILNLFILPFRPKQSAKAYSRIWNGKSFPLIDYSESFKAKVENELNNLDATKVDINMSYILSDPRPKDLLAAWDKEDFKTRANHLLVIPQFPQYAEATIASGVDCLFNAAKDRSTLPSFEVIDSYHTSKAFIDQSARKINEYLESHPQVDHLFFSFHGIPKRRVILKKDPYYRHCLETFVLLKSKVNSSVSISFSFQSRFGSEEWLTPYTDDHVKELIAQGKKNIAVYCPSFVVDCLETIDEIGTELRHDVESLGAQLHLIECLNDDDQWAKAYAHFLYDYSKGGFEKRKTLFYKIDDQEIAKMPQQTLSSPPLSPMAKKSLKIVFFTLFMDLVGFAIIFPMFPAMAKHYLAVDGDNYFLNLIFSGIETLTLSSQAKNTFSPIVLFGGALGALYSLLQFVCAPIWGVLSDRVGRKPILLISVFGLAASYLLWVFSGSFTLLILARFIGGIMGGNISTATAVVGDVTSKENRAKGMAFVGIAFACGFTFGPALGGLMTLIRLDEMYPALISYGVNPFSCAALVAFALSSINFIYLYKSFEETLPVEKRGQSEESRSSNPLTLFKPLPIKEVNLTNIGYFIFLFGFSGMEFTLTFLAVDRLGYTSMDNAYMFIFIGFVLAMVQGGYVRRKANIVGEKRMALQGMVVVVPGLALIALAHSSAMLYAGLFFLSIGSAMVIPCLTSLVSIYSPMDLQGKAIGIFRSLGALARVFGPIAASVVYWKYGADMPYYIGILVLLPSIYLISKLPKRINT